MKCLMLLTDIHQIVGRCGQAILAFFSHQVFTKALLRSMETSQVSYDTFGAITLRDISLSGFFSLCRDLSFKRSLRTNLALLWIVISASFILVFPTLAGAMTGYNINTQALVEGEDGQLIVFSEFQLVLAIIYDGWRVGRTGPYLITKNFTFYPGKPASEPMFLTT
jgi:hypothetical protein